jgi:hypothetical protein
MSRRKDAINELLITHYLMHHSSAFALDMMRDLGIRSGPMYGSLRNLENQGLIICELVNPPDIKGNRRCQYRLANA